MTLDLLLKIEFPFAKISELIKFFLTCMSMWQTSRTTDLQIPNYESRVQECVARPSASCVTQND